VVDFFIVIPVFKRPELTTATIKHYNEMCLRMGNARVVVIGQYDELLEYKRLKLKALEYVGWSDDESMFNLHNKFNAGFRFCKKQAEKSRTNLNVVNVALVGSDDIITHEYFTYAIERIRCGIDCVGLIDCYLVDREREVVYYWPGYRDLYGSYNGSFESRYGESIAAGRVMSGRFLKKVNWLPFGDDSYYHNTDQIIYNDDETNIVLLRKHAARIDNVCMAKIGCIYMNVKTGMELNSVQNFLKSHSSTMVDITQQSHQMLRILECRESLQTDLNSK